MQASRGVGVDEELPSRGARHLMDASIPIAPANADADITVVITAQEFQAALTSGAQDVELRAHVDLTEMALAFNSNVSLTATVLGDIKPSTRSIRVRFMSLDCQAVLKLGCFELLVVSFGGYHARACSRDVLTRNKRNTMFPVTVE